MDNGDRIALCCGIFMHWTYLHVFLNGDVPAEKSLKNTRTKKPVQHCPTRVITVRTNCVMKKKDF